MCLMWQNEHCRCERPSQLRFHECLPSAQTRRSCHQHGFTSNSVKYGLQIWLTSTRLRRPTPPTEKRVQAASTDVCRLGRRMLRQSSSAVATSREGHRSPRSDREGQPRRWGRGWLPRRFERSKCRVRPPPLVAYRAAYKEKAPLRCGAGVKEARVGLSRLLGRLVPAGARSIRQPRLWLHLFGLIQLCGLLREKKVCSDIWRSRRSSS